MTNDGSWPAAAFEDRLPESSRLAIQRNFPLTAYWHHVEFTQSANTARPDCGTVTWTATALRNLSDSQFPLIDQCGQYAANGHNLL